jgi:drug/metabolite transporter (DMT)-like permease
MSTEQPTASHASTQRTTSPVPGTGSPGHRSAGFRNLTFAYVVGVALVVLQSVAYHHYAPNDGSVGQDVPVYFVSGLIGCLIAAIGLFRVARGHKLATTPRVGIVLSALGLVIFPVAYFTPITFIWGVTSYLLSRDSEPGPLRTAARVLGIVALCLTPLVVLLRAAGVTYQLGG